MRNPVAGNCRLIYLSRSRIEGEASAVDSGVRRIVVTARERNLAAGISGVLLFDRRRFAQILEGDCGEVERTYGRVERDRRHTDVRLISIDPMPFRLFPNWSMGFVRGGEGVHGYPLANIRLDRTLGDVIGEQAIRLIEILGRRIAEEV
jgi:hypothetical protein